MKSLRSRVIGKLWRTARSIQSAGNRRGLGKLTATADVCILDPWYPGPDGHHECWNLALVATAKRRGLGAAILASEQLSHSFVQQGPCLPFFAGPPYPFSRTAADLLADVSRATTAVADGLAALARIRPSGMPALLMHTPVLHHLFALADFFERAGHDAPRLALLMHLPPELTVTPSVAPFAHSLFRDGLNRLLAAGAGKVSAFAASHCVAEHLANLGGVLLPVAHPPITFPPELPPLPPDIARALLGTGDLPVLVFVGSGRREKGLHLLLDALGKMHGSRPVARCVVIISESLAELGLSAPPCGDLLTVFERVCLHPKELLSVFAASDGIVLPYDPASYRNRLSNMVLEAAGIGTPFISTGGACSTRTESEALGITSAVWMESHTADALVRAIEKFAREVPDLRQRARSQAADFRNAFSGDPLFNALLGR